MKLRWESFLRSRRTLKGVVLHLWAVYSSPAPSGGDVLALLLLCCCLAATTGGLLYRWLAGTLSYSPRVSAQTACVYGALMLLASFLCHPLRCVLTMTLPVVCTKQGRKRLLSASVMVLVLNVVPNMALNFGAVAQVLRCTTEGFTRSLLNSSRPLNRAKEDLVREMRNTDLWSNVKQLEKFAQLTNVDVSEVKVRFMQMIGQIEQNFSQTKELLQSGLLLANRVLAALFVALLVFESSLYLKSYLSSVRFCNGSKERLQKGAAGPRCPLSSLRCGIRTHERSSCAVALLLVTFYFLAITLTVTLDYVVYHVVDLIVPWLLNFPSTSAIFGVIFQVDSFLPALCIVPEGCRTWSLIDFQREYAWSYDPEPSLCEASASPPSRGVAVLLGCLCLMSYVLVFLEVYAKRLCRKICASFFREQEKKRRRYLRKKEEKVFTISGSAGHRWVKPHDIKMC